MHPILGTVNQLSDVRRCKYPDLILTIALIFLFQVGCSKKDPPNPMAAPVVVAQPTAPVDVPMQNPNVYDAPGPVRIGEVKIIVFAFKENVEIEKLFGTGISKDPCMVFILGIRNTNPGRKITYQPWTPPDIRRFYDERTYARLSDDRGNKYHHIGFGFSTKIPGQHSTNTSVYQDRTETDVLVFERPVPAATQLNLELPMDHLGGEGTIHLRFSMQALPQQVNSVAGIAVLDWDKFENEQRTRAAQEEKERIARTRTVEQWIDVIRQGDAVTTTEARAELVRRGRVTIPVLRASIRDKNARVRQAAIEILAEIGEPARDAIPDFVQALDDHDNNVRIAAMKAIQRFGPASRMALAKLLTVSATSESPVSEKQHGAHRMRKDLCESG